MGNTYISLKSVGFWRRFRLKLVLLTSAGFYLFIEENLDCFQLLCHFTFLRRKIYDIPDGIPSQISIAITVTVSK